MSRLKWCLPLVLAGLWTGGARPAAADHSPHGRVSSVRGNLLVKGPDDNDWSYVERNGVVYDDDVVWADEDSQAEIEMERGAWVRLGPDTRVEVKRLPPDGVLRLKRGSIYVDLADSGGEGVAVQTPSGDVMVEPGSLARVDLDRDDDVRVVVRRGRVSGAIDRGPSRRADAGDVLYLQARAPRPRLEEINDRDFDAFDDWSDDRVSFYLSRQLPRGVDHYIPGVYELSDYGEWVGVDGVMCWRPRCDAEWRPYSHGYWGYWRGQPLWISDDPWGYTTCHYGRWMWADRYGWLWRPGYDWGPAYVHWAQCGETVAWVPLDPYDRPCYRERPRDVGGVLIDVHCWSCMPRENFWRRDRTQIIVVERAPRVVVTEIRPVREVTVIYHDVPPQARCRGVWRTEYVSVPPRDRLVVLEHRAPRADYRCAEIRRPEVRPVGSLMKPVFRAEAQQQVRRQRVVPAVHIDRTAVTPAAVGRQNPQGPGRTGPEPGRGGAAAGAGAGAAVTSGAGRGNPPGRGPRDDERVFQPGGPRRDGGDRPGVDGRPDRPQERGAGARGSDGPVHTEPSPRDRDADRDRTQARPGVLGQPRPGSDREVERRPQQPGTVRTDRQNDRDRSDSRPGMLGQPRGGGEREGERRPQQPGSAPAGRTQAGERGEASGVTVAQPRAGTPARTGDGRPAQPAAGASGRAPSGAAARTEAGRREPEKKPARKPNGEQDRDKREGDRDREHDAGR